jgi:flagellar hook protein FlgE
MAVQGDGYFVVGDGSQDFYTRDGAFDVGIDNTLVSPSSGLHVMGWQADPVTGAINTASPTTPITIPLGAGMTGKPSTTVDVAGNLDANTAVGAANEFQMDGTAYDSLGNAIKYTLHFAKSANNTWGVTATSTDAGAAPLPLASVALGATTLTFNASGKIDAPGGLATLSLVTQNGSATPQGIALDLSKITQLAATPSNLTSSTDGAEAGTLTMFTVGASGEITGSYSNGFKQTLGQIALATFSNPSGLVKSGNNLFTGSANSGTPQVGLPDSGGRGKFATGFLEGSNVDLAQQFTNMIMAERGFQANSKVITTSDEILQDLVNLKH